MKQIILSLISMAFLLTACTYNNIPVSERAIPTFPPDPVPLSSAEYSRITDLICRTQTRESCLEEICRDSDVCPLVIALSNQVVFQFIDTFSSCEDCNTETFSVQRGIGKCIEYSISDLDQQWKVEFWVAENCSFQYGSPSKSRVSVLVSKETLAIEQITPPIPYIEDRLFCEEDSDCRCLSGSGVPSLGCSNTLYSPLHFAGDYQCDRCVCRNKQCTTTE